MDFRVRKCSRSEKRKSFAENLLTHTDFLANMCIVMFLNVLLNFANFATYIGNVLE